MAGKSISVLESIQWAQPQDQCFKGLHASFQPMASQVPAFATMHCIQLLVCHYKYCNLNVSNGILNQYKKKDKKWLWGIGNVYLTF